jgi:hypothetical protein
MECDIYSVNSFAIMGYIHTQNEQRAKSDILEGWGDIKLEWLFYIWTYK